MKSPRVRLRQSNYTGQTGNLTWFKRDCTTDQWISTVPPVPSKYEFMEDVVGNIGCDFNPCYHEKYFALPPQYAKTLVLDTVAMPCTSTLQWSTGGIYVDAREALHNISIPELPDWLDDFGARAEHHHVTAVDESASLVNFLLELEDLATFNVKSLKSLGDNLLRALKKFREVLAKTGKFWLAWNFAWKPFLADVKAFLDVVKKARKRLLWLKKRNHLDTKVYYREGPRSYEGSASCAASLPVGDGPSIPINNPNFISGTIDWKAKVTLASHAWVRFDIDDAYLDMTLGLGMVISAMNGLYNPLSIAWEAIPFSWLIDWFLSARTRLKFKRVNLNPFKDATLLGSGHSIRLDLSFQITTHVKGAQPYDMDCTSGIGEYYVRIPGYPEPDSSPFRVPIEWYNVSILSALLVSKRRRG